MCERAHVYEVPTTKSVTDKNVILNKVLVNNNLRVKGNTINHIGNTINHIGNTINHIGNTINHIGNTNSIFNEEVFLAWL